MTSNCSKPGPARAVEFLLALDNGTWTTATVEVPAALGEDREALVAHAEDHFGRQARFRNVVVWQLYSIPENSERGEAGDEAEDECENKCDCELPGYFYTGVPGILGRLENGRVAPGAKVERCDLCQRYESDEAALAKLRESGLA